MATSVASSAARSRVPERSLAGSNAVSQGRRAVARATLLVGLLLLAVLAAGILLWTVWIGPAMAPTENAVEPAPIDGERAYDYLKQICALGPRPAGSQANTAQRKMVADHFKAHGAIVTEQPFAARDPLTGQRRSMANLIGSWFPDRTDRVVVAAHYDTRPFPDREDDPALRQGPFLGANDGASGVALLMEFAHHMKDLSTPWGVDLVLFDGEELVYDTTGEYFLGSKVFSRNYASARKSGKAKYRYGAGILLDMVGGRDLHIKREPHSMQFAPQLVQDVWRVARQVGAEGFTNEEGVAVNDDHLAMNDARIPTIDIIDFDYPQWHRAGDLPEACSAASLAEVGRVVTAWLTLPKPKPRRR
jgi:hypothetical protein